MIHRSMIKASVSEPLDESDIEKLLDYFESEENSLAQIEDEGGKISFGIMESVCHAVNDLLLTEDEDYIDLDDLNQRLREFDVHEKEKARKRKERVASGNVTPRKKWNSPLKSRSIELIYRYLPTIGIELPIGSQDHVIEIMRFLDTSDPNDDCKRFGPRAGVRTFHDIALAHDEIENIVKTGEMDLDELNSRLYTIRERSSKIRPTVSDHGLRWYSQFLRDTICL